MDLIEACGPLVDTTMRSAATIEHAAELPSARGLAQQVQKDMATVHGNLSEVLLAQGYQDLSGQIIRGVMTLVQELEHALSGLVQLAAAGGERLGSAPKSATKLAGPEVPGVDHGGTVVGQDDIDALMSGTGV